MELKKHPKADLEKHKTTFSLIGFVVTLGLIYFAFEYTTTTAAVDQLSRMSDVVLEDEIIPITRNEQTPPPPPPPPKAPAEILDIVDDDEKIEEEMEVEDAEAKESDKVEIVEIEEEEEVEEQPFVIVENMPEYPGGQIELMKYIAQNVRYPNVARENGIQGKVFVRFVVTKTGGVDKVTVARSVDPLLDQEAIRVVKTLPKWKPGMQRGKTVPVWYTVPINFQLQ